MSKTLLFVIVLFQFSILGLGCGGNSEPQQGGDGDAVSVKDTAPLQTDVTPGDQLSNDATADQAPPLDQQITPDDAVDTSPGDVTIGPKPVDYLIIAADGLSATATAFSDYRALRGYKTAIKTVTEILGNPTAETNASAVAKIKEAIRGYYDKRDTGRPFYVLIVGAAEDTTPGTSGVVPIGFKLTGHVDPDTYSDNLYADMDGDDVPDLAIGRIPVRTNEHGLAVLEKVKTHENSYVLGEWNRRIAVYTGEGGFGVEIDTMIEAVARMVLEDIPYDLDVSFAYNNPKSVYYYAPFYDKVVDMLTDGAIVAVFVGHGGGELNVQDLEQIKVQHRSPVLAFFACQTGSIVGKNESEIEHLIRLPGAPMAALVSYVDSHPYGNAIMARELQSVLLKQRVATYGEVVRMMKVRSMTAEPGDTLRTLIDAFTKGQIPEADMALIRTSHLYIYHLIGDPALQVRFPQGKVAITANASVQAGQTLAVSGTTTAVTDGQVKLSIVTTRSTVPSDLTPVDNPTIQANWPTVQANYDKVMQRTVSEQTVTVTSGSFSGSLPVPAGLEAGTYYVKAYAYGGNVDAIGVWTITVAK